MNLNLPCFHKSIKQGISQSVRLFILKRATSFLHTCENIKPKLNIKK